MQELAEEYGIKPCFHKTFVQTKVLRLQSVQEILFRLSIKHDREDTLLIFVIENCTASFFSS